MPDLDETNPLFIALRDAVASQNAVASTLTAGFAEGTVAGKAMIAVISETHSLEAGIVAVAMAAAFLNVVLDSEPACPDCGVQHLDADKVAALTALLQGYFDVAH